MTNELSSIKLASNSVTTQLQNLPQTEYRFRAFINTLINLFDFLIFFTLIYLYRDQSTEIEPYIQVKISIFIMKIN